ncbi:MAG: tyrosine-type recombinase/integrase [Gammaproteobacteria bacterium]
MTKKTHYPKPLFETLDNIDDTPSCVKNYIQTLGIPHTETEYRYATEFLKSYQGSQDTFTSYRREVERLFQWAWLIAKKPINALTRNDIRDYLHFIQAPPSSWVGTKTVARFKLYEGERVFNSDWRPLVVRLSKAQFKSGIQASRTDYQLSNASIQALFAGLSTFFTYLVQENYLDNNPVSLIRQKKQFIQHEQTRKVTRKLSQKQWLYVINTIESLAQKDPQYERELFIMTAFYLLGLRISELSETPGRIPSMSDFAPDKHGLWWFTTVGKGNKVRDIAVSDEMLEALKRYRTKYCQLPPLPTRSEQTPLVAKKRGRGGLGTRQIRNLVQGCFDRAVTQLAKDSDEDQAQDLMSATVHWLRHTSISSDVEFRPREHVRDDVGHENANIMNKYIDDDRIARHQSAQHKKLKPIT